MPLGSFHEPYSPKKIKKVLPSWAKPQDEEEGDASNVLNKLGTVNVSISGSSTLEKDIMEDQKSSPFSGFLSNKVFDKDTSISSTGKSFTTPSPGKLDLLMTSSDSPLILPS